MKCNYRRWLWGIVPIVILCLAAVHFERGRIEQDLAERAGNALTQGGSTWALAAFEGRDVVLSGRAPDEDGPGKAADTLQGVWGVRIVDNRAGLLERAENYIWAASRRGERVRISGYAPSQDARQIISSVAKANLPGSEVADKTRLARGVPQLDTWLAGVSFALRQLASLKRGDVRLDGLNLTVAGEAEDLSNYRAVRNALASGLPKGIKLAANLVTPPVVKPHTWVAGFEKGRRLTLSGHMPDEGRGSALVALANAAAPGLAVENRMQPAGGAVSGWQDVASAALRALLNLESGSAELKDAVLTMSGIAADPGTLQTLRATLQASLPEPFKLSDEMRAPEPLIVPPPPPLPPPPAELLPPEPAPAAAAPASPLPETLAIPSPPAIPPPPPELLPPPSAPATVAAQTPPPERLATQSLPAGQAEAIPPPPANVIGNADVTALARESAAAAPSAPAPVASAAPGGQAPAPQPIPPPPASVVPAIDVSEAARASVCQEKLTAVAGGGRIQFRVGSADLDPASHPLLDGLAGAAAVCPGLRIEIEGHASAEGGIKRNQELSVQRAQAVAAYLAKAGFDRKLLTAVGYGETRPLVPNDSDENLARNRRVELTVHGPKGRASLQGRN